MPSLLQWRALREQQDKEYRESLMKDQEKVGSGEVGKADK